MKRTKNYNIPKPELSDAFDITTLHEIIDSFDTLTKNTETIRDGIVTEEATRVSNENTRVLNENTRIANEDIRKASELSRNDKEVIRESNEKTRQNNENTRISQENDRVLQENSRKSAESSRVNAENTRNSNETLRQDNEKSRQGNESTRQSNEKNRISQENARVTAENNRVSQENSRISEENKRVEQENIRITNEENRISQENARVNAENIRISQEDIRKTNENARISEEDKRKANESTRESNEVTRQNNELNRINAEEIRNTSENLRISNENTRQDNENIRLVNEQNREANEADRQNTINALKVYELYDNTKNYVPLNKVVYEGSCYVNLIACKGVLPTDTTHWLCIAEKGSADDIRNLQQQISDLQGFIGYTDNDIVGVEADFVNKKFTRLAGAVNKNPGADFDSINAFGGRKRCIVTDDGVILAYYGEPGYSETGATTVEITKNSVTYPVGTPVQVMVEQPKFYYKVVPLQLEPITDGIGYHLRKARYYICDTPKVGFKVHPAFVRNGVEVDKIYLSAYEGSIYDVSAGTYLLADEQIADFNADKLSSIANAKPVSGLTQNLTRANTRKLANNRGAGWQLSDVLSVSVTQMLFVIEYASFNAQDKIGLGVVNKSPSTRNEAEITGTTTNLGNTSGMADGTNGFVSVTYRGEENFWGNIWYWVDGLNIESKGIYQAYWADHDFQENIKTSPYKNCGFTPVKANGFVSAFGYSEDCDFLFLPSETVGNSSLPVGDNFWQHYSHNEFLVTQLGAYWADGSMAGAFSWIMLVERDFNGQTYGGRLLYVPQAS